MLRAHEDGSPGATDSGAALAGALDCGSQIRKQSRSLKRLRRSRSVSIVRRYIRDAELFDDNAAAGIGL